MLVAEYSDLNGVAIRRCKESDARSLRGGWGILVIGTVARKILGMARSSRQ
jgi:hypothetical protein